MEAIREWLMSVVSCAMLLGICRRFSGGGATGEIMKFTGGLLLVLALLAPVKQVRLQELSLDFADYDSALRATKSELSAQRENALREDIEERTSAYIEAKSDELGLAVRAQVTAEHDGSVWLPRYVVLHGTRSEALADWIEHTLGIERQAQEWRESD